VWILTILLYIRFLEQKCMLAKKFSRRRKFHPVQRLLYKLKTSPSANFYSEQKTPQIKKSPFL
jgi:hypothetical protein